MSKAELNQEKIELGNIIQQDLKATEYQEKVNPKEYEAIIKPSEQRAQHIIKKYPKLKYISFLLTGFFGLHRLVRGLLIIVVIFSSIMSYLEDPLLDAILYITSLSTVIAIGITVYGLIIKSYSNALKFLSKNNDLEQFRMAFIDIFNAFIDLNNIYLKNAPLYWEFNYTANLINFKFELPDEFFWDEDNLYECLKVIFNREMSSYQCEGHLVNFSLKFTNETVFSKREHLEKLNQLHNREKQENLFLYFTEQKNIQTKGAPLNQEFEQLAPDHQENEIASEKINEEKHDVDNVEEIYSRFDTIIGLEPVKDKVRQLINNQMIEHERQLAGQKTKYHSEHMLFTGNPGTGKTMIARYISEILHALKVVSKGHLVEVTRKDLVGEHVGHTANLTQSYIEKAMGGILFIDEAYALSRGDNNDFGKEAIDVLVKAMDEYKDDLIVILAGYTNEMFDFLQANSGLRSRLSTIIEFPDYTVNELTEMALKKLRANTFELGTKAEQKLEELLQSRMISGRNDEGNGRLVDKVIQEIIKNQGNRLAEATKSCERMEGDLLKILPEDIIIESYSESFDLESELEKIIGNEEVKLFIRQLGAQVRVNNMRKEQNIKVGTSSALHMIFQGNPGTGKTTCARIISELLHNLGMLKKGHLVEVDRSDLVGAYIGHTEEKTKRVIDKALGGVLFIDEAYTLARSGEKDFGQEAIDVILKAMEDFRENLVVIAAGYKEEMHRFIKSNPGLSSRIPNVITFSDYTVDEMYEILKVMAKNEGFEIEASCEMIVKELFQREKEKEQPGNGRYVRNLFEKAIRSMSLRLSKNDNHAYQELITLKVSDFQNEIDQVNVTF